MRLSMTATLLLFAAVGMRADAQSTTTRFAVTGGVATDQRGVRSSALSFAPSVSIEPRQSVSVLFGGSATRFASGAFSFGAGGSVSAVNPIGRFAAATLGGSANVARLNGSSRATFAQADLLPAIELRLRPLTLFGGVRVASGTAAEESSTGIPLPGARPDRTSASRAGVGPVFGGVVTFAFNRLSLRVGAREERLRVSGVSMPERSLSAELGVAITATTTLEIGAGRYDDNRLLGTTAGDYLSAGFSLRFGGTREPSLPEARGAQPARSGSTRLAIRAPDARRVEVAGDFNEWTPVPATRAVNGVWYVDLMILPGQYRYAFRVNGIEWRVPDGATAVDDGFGGKSAWLTVSDARSASKPQGGKK
jgi:hypothetical protein